MRVVSAVRTTLSQNVLVTMPASSCNRIAPPAACAWLSQKVLSRTSVKVVPTEPSPTQRAPPPFCPRSDETELRRNSERSMRVSVEPPPSKLMFIAPPSPAAITWLSMNSESVTEKREKGCSAPTLPKATAPPPCADRLRWNAEASIEKA
jgi:hypothetical protein